MVQPYVAMNDLPDYYGEVNRFIFIMLAEEGSDHAKHSNLQQISSMMTGEGNFIAWMKASKVAIDLEGVESPTGALEYAEVDTLKVASVPDYEALTTGSIIRYQNPLDTFYYNLMVTEKQIDPGLGPIIKVSPSLEEAKLLIGEELFFWTYSVSSLLVGHTVSIPSAMLLGMGGGLSLSKPRVMSEGIYVDDFYLSGAAIDTPGSKISISEKAFLDGMLTTPNIPSGRVYSSVACDKMAVSDPEGLSVTSGDLKNSNSDAGSVFRIRNKLGEVSPYYFKDSIKIKDYPTESQIEINHYPMVEYSAFIGNGTAPVQRSIGKLFTESNYRLQSQLGYSNFWGDISYDPSVQGFRNDYGDGMFFVSGRIKLWSATNSPNPYPIKFIPMGTTFWVYVQVYNHLGIFDHGGQENRTFPLRYNAGTTSFLDYLEIGYQSLVYVKKGHSIITIIRASGPDSTVHRLSDARSVGQAPSNRNQITYIKSGGV